MSVCLRVMSVIAPQTQISNDFLGTPHWQDFAGIKQMFASLVKRVARYGTVVLVIDGLDQLEVSNTR